MHRLVLIILILASLLLNVAHAQAIRNGEDLLRAMHERYKDSWYQTLTFTQKSTTYKPDGTSSAETWYEAMFLPGRLRIDIGPTSNGKGYIFSNGNVTVIKDNKVIASVKSINMLFVLGFDVYRQDPEATINVVRNEGYDLSKLREDLWDGKPVYVMGAEKGDLKSKQFWVAKDTLLFVREIEPRARQCCEARRHPVYSLSTLGWGLDCGERGSVLRGQESLLRGLF